MNLPTNKIRRTRIQACCGTMLFLVLVTFQAASAATGIFITKETASHPDRNAKVAEYNQVSRAGEVTYFLLPSGIREEVTQFQLLGFYPYVNPKIRNIRAHQLQASTELLAKFEDISKRHDQARPLLASQLRILREVVTNLKAGREWFDGEWMKQSEVVRIIEERRQDSLDQVANENRMREKLRRQQRIDELDRDLKKLNDQLGQKSDVQADLISQQQDLENQQLQLNRRIEKQLKQLTEAMDNIP